MTTQLKQQIRKRDRLFKQARRTQLAHDWDKWKQQRNTTTELNKTLKENYLTQQVNVLVEQKTNPYKYHKTLKRITGANNDHTLPPLEKHNGDIATTDPEKANLLNDFFANQSRLPSIDSPLPTTTQNPPTVPLLSDITVTEHEVLKILNSLDPNKSCGSDTCPIKY